MEVYEGTGEAVYQNIPPLEDDDVSLTQHETSEDSFKCFSKAMELPLVSGLTVSVAATTEYITSTRPVSKVTETIQTVSERNDVKSVINSVQTIYDNNLASRVEDLKTTINPTLKNLDDYACSGLDKVNGKVAETKEAYVDPVVDKVNMTKETYVDPAIEKVTDIKDKTTQIVAGCMDTASNVRTNYINPAMDVATTVKDNYVVPALCKAYTASEDPSKAYSEAVVYGKELIILAKDGAINKTINTVDSAKQYLISTKDSTVDKVVGDQSY